MCMCEVCEHGVVTHRGLRRASELELLVVSCEMFYIGAGTELRCSQEQYVLLTAEPFC